MKQSSARILNSNPGALAVTASAARMSTQQGTALEIYARSGDGQKDLNLIGKVLSSGHKSVIEHQTISVAFNDVSVMVEQYVIEFRLASFTVKSRRYVDFSEAGYVLPESLRNAPEYAMQMERLFHDYQALLEMGIPKEDARFLLPYSLRSNFFMTLNARELIYMICSMIVGRGARFDELRSLGQQLKEQFDGLYPGVIDAEANRYPQEAMEFFPDELRLGTDVKGSAALVGHPVDAEELLERALAFSRRFEPSLGRTLNEDNMHRLLNDPRPRELELLNYTFHVQNASLACVTHFTRHRIQSPLIPGAIRALCGGSYVLPESVAANSQAEEIYRRAFADQTAAARQMLKAGMPREMLAYYAMSGHVLDLMLGMNARELLHFAQLRTCARAQWEIRGIAREMLMRVNEISPAIFRNYGPSCAVSGRCPEGRMSCGHPVRIVDGQWQQTAASDCGGKDR